MDLPGLQPSSEEIKRMNPKKKSRSSNSEHTQRLTAFGVSLSTTLSEVVLVYPCLVLRRQCQVNNVGRKYHFTPFTIVTVAWKLQRVQGVTCLWKGIGSNLLVNALTFGVENGISESSKKFPKEIDSHSTMKEVGGHLLLKIFSYSLTLPFYSAHLVESIQSEAASETPGIFYCITEGFARLFGLAGVQSRRMLPFRYLLVPTVLYLLLRYILASSIQFAILGAFRFHEKWSHERLLNQSRPPLTPNEDYMSMPTTPDTIEQSIESAGVACTHAQTQHRELLSSFVANLVTDVLLYPFECVINRLHVQGTRTIIDDMDRGSGFLPVSSRYEGFFDCVLSVKAQEGKGGLYRGFGALILQHTLKFATMKLLQLALKISFSDISLR